MLQRVIKNKIHINGETPVELIDSINTVFTTQFQFEAGSLSIYLNGLRLREGATNDYIILNDETFELNLAPITFDTLEVDYVRK